MLVEISPARAAPRKCPKPATRRWMPSQLPHLPPQGRLDDGR